MRTFWYVLSIATVLLGVINFIAFGVGGHWQNLVVGILDIVFGLAALLLTIMYHIEDRRIG